MHSKKIIIFTGPSLHPDEASKILDADYRPPIKRGDVTTALNENPDIIGIIDGVFHQTPAVSHREILDALKKGVIVVGGASMGALRASELDDFGMVGIGYVYKQYKEGFIESDDDVAIVMDPITLKQISDSLVSMEYSFKTALNNGLISKSEFKKLIHTAKSIFYPKRNYNLVLSNVDIDPQKVAELKEFLDEHGIDIKRNDAIDVVKYIKSLNSL
ncbi:MAG: TfuA-related McrA-glycine thioamidation protein [Methanobacterium sp.]|uniref:TfuA-related McrA-glycine thioamidation protein n=1 Tax=Methanobacterium sp. TaxID=2164 RepID=UPI003D65BB54|nr:TfuA-related McrA-glycine thioamidation protein [Methanobacterium sp.]